MAQARKKNPKPADAQMRNATSKEQSRQHGTIKRYGPEGGISRERFRAGVWDIARAQHPDGRGGILESLTVRDLSAMAGGAGLLFFRGSISREQFLAASWVMEKYEAAYATGRSVSDLREKVDGGRGSDGMMSLKAAFSGLSLEEALTNLQPVERDVVRAVVLDGLALLAAGQRIAAPEWSGISREKTMRERVLVQLCAGLDKVAVYAAWRNWG